MLSSQLSNKQRDGSTENAASIRVDDEENTNKSVKEDDATGSLRGKENGTTSSKLSEKTTTFHDCDSTDTSLGGKEESTDDNSFDNSNATNSAGSSCDENDAGACFIEELLPSQLHPAVSLGMHRASSFYFSVSDDFDTSNSMADLLSLLTTNDDESVHNNSTFIKPVLNTATSTTSTTSTATTVPHSTLSSKNGDNDKAIEVVEPSSSSYDPTVTANSSHDSSSIRATCSSIDKENSAADDRIGSDETSISAGGNKNVITEMELSKSSLLYHDITMHVLTFLDAHSLASFSETAKQPNFDCFYFLQLQLQRSLVLATSYKGSSKKKHRKKRNIHDEDKLAAIAGSAYISRLASMNLQEARDVVQEYSDSNSTLNGTMPLSHSLAYIRHVLRNGGLFHMMSKKNDTFSNNNHGIGKAAVLISVLGAASLLSGSAEVHVPDLAELSNLLISLGFVGSIMGAASHTITRNEKDDGNSAGSNTNDATNDVTAQSIDGSNNNTNGVIGTAESMLTRTLEDLPAPMSAPLRRIIEAFRATYSTDTATSKAGNPSLDTNDSNNDETVVSGILNKRATSDDSPIRHQLTTPNPYEHLPPTTPYQSSGGLSETKEKEPCKVETKIEQIRNQQQKIPKKVPTGCVGAYFHAIHRANNKITEIIKEQRKCKYLSLSNNEERSTSFIDACGSDDTIHLVKEMVHTMDVDGFYVSSDGTETCALHAAAFHCASNVLSFLCQGIDDDITDGCNIDGGLCFVDKRDENGWTAIHFAAGANSIDAVRILADHGADLGVEAVNGYTPIQWAQRLQHHEVAEEIRKRHVLQLKHQPSKNKYSDLPFKVMGSARERLTALQQFFSLIPTQ